MFLNNILKLCKTNHLVENFRNKLISGIAINSKVVRKNFIFGAIKGNSLNGEIFINSLLKLSSIVVVIESKSKIMLDFKQHKNITIIRTSNVRMFIAEIASIFYPNSIREKIAITGTNGKSSIVNYTKQLWNLKKINNGSLGTLGGFLNNKKIKDLSLTTPDPVVLNQTLNILSKKKCKKVILEASSIGLDQGRLHPIKFKKVVFTNLTRDHLDYHQTLTRYKNAKLILFEKHTTRSSQVILNTDDRHSNFFLNFCRQKKLEVLDFGKKAGFLKIISIERRKDSFSVRISLRGKYYIIDFDCLSIFEIYNMICCLIIVFGKNIKHKDFQILRKLKQPPGRLENIYCKRRIKVFVDYAHTPDALENVLDSLKRISTKKLLVVFGCGGERDKTKRNLMTKCAIDYADKIILTEDNPRNENPLKIFDDMVLGIQKKDLKKIKIIRNRKKAIKFSVDALSENDILLIAGKGHENYQIIKNKKTIFNDKDVALEFLRKRHALES